MKTINLRDCYEHIGVDTYININDEVYDIFETERKAEQAYQSKLYYHNAYYSLDAGDGIESCALFASLSPYEVHEGKLTKERLYTATSLLPEKQAKRIFSHYFLRISKADIAKAEGVSPSTVKDAIYRGLRNLGKYLKDER